MATRGVRRGGVRGFGRGGFANRTGGAASSSSMVESQQSLGELIDELDPEEAPETAQLRARYGSALETLKPLFPSWREEDLLNTIALAGGQVELAATRIAEGHAEQFESVPSKKTRQQQSARINPSSAGATSSFSAAGTPAVALAGDNAAFSGFAGRGRGRGGFVGRGRGEFRGGRGGFRGAGRGGIRPATNGHLQPSAAPPSTTVVSSTEETPEGTTTTTIETTEQGDQAQVALTQTTTVDGAEESTTVVETVTVKDVPADIPPTTPAAANGLSKGKSTARVIAPGAKMSWAQIARPPPPPQPKPEVKPAPIQPSAAATPVVAIVESTPLEAASTIAAQEPEVVIAVTEETLPLLAAAAAAAEPDASAAAQDPWGTSPAPAAAPGEPAPMGVGEGWAEAIISQEPSAPNGETTAQHQRAEEAVPEVGINPAGPLDVHTPALESVPATQQDASASSATAAAGVPAAAPASSDRIAPPPGFGKRTSSRLQQDAPVVISGTSHSPSVEGVGVQFGSLSLFGDFQAQLPQQEKPQSPVQPQQQIQIPEVQQQQQSAQQALYETPVPEPAAQEPNVQEPVQAALQNTFASFPASTTDHSQYSNYQAAPQQQQQQPFGQHTYSQDRFGGLGGGYGGQSQQGLSAYANRYPQMHSPFGQQPLQQQQQQQAQSQPSAQQQQHDPFASLTGGSTAAAASPYAQQQLQQGGGLSVDSISPYFSSQQAQQQQQQAVAAAQSPAPVPASTRDVGTASTQTGPGNASAYSGFTSALGQGQQSSYPTDYASLYGMQQQQQDPMRNLGFYNQYDQQAQQQSRPSVTEETAKLGSGAPASALGGAAQAVGQQQQQQPQTQHQQQQYPPNFAPYGYPYHQYYGMPQYNQHQGGYPGYPSHSPYAPYPGYGAPGAAAGRGYQAQQGQQGSQGGYRGGFGSSHTPSGAGNMPHPSAYGSGAYGGFDRSASQSQGSNAQETRNTNTKDVFDDRFFSGRY